MRHHAETQHFDYGQVLAACLQTSIVLGAFALVLRSRAEAMSVGALHTDPAQVAKLLAGLTHCHAPQVGDVLLEHSGVW